MIQLQKKFLKVIKIKLPLFLGLKMMLD